MDAAQAARIAELEEKCAVEIEELRGKQKQEYDILVNAHAPHNCSQSLHARSTTPGGGLVWVLCAIFVVWFSILRTRSS